MIFNLLVNADPATEAAYAAYYFAEAALKKGHTIRQVFFYQDGAYTVSESIVHSLWADLAKTHSIALVVCVAAALRRHIVSEGDTRYGPFQIAGLGQWVEAITQADRFITFNP